LSHESSLKKNMVAELSQSHHASNKGVNGKFLHQQVMIKTAIFHFILNEQKK